MKRLIWVLSALSMQLGMIAQGQQTPETSDFRLSMTNALISTLQNSRRFSLDLAWDFLPPANHVANLKETYALSWKDAKDGLWGEWKIANKDIASGTAWNKLIAKLDKPGKVFLGKVLNAGRPMTLDSKTDISKVLRDSIGQLQQATGSLKAWGPVDQFPTASPDIETQADFGTLANYRFCLAMLKTLVDSKGMGVRIDEHTGKLRLSGPRYLKDEIVWTIRAYRLNYYTDQAEIPEAYTITISANVRNVRFDTISVDPTSINSISLDMVAGLLREVEVPGVEKKLLAMVPYTVAQGGVSVDSIKPLPGASDLSQTKISPSTTSTVIGAITGVKTSTIAESIFANNPDARLFAGGLVGDGSVQRVLGVNMPVATESNWGVLFGVMPDRANSLFIGPSVAVGPLTLGVGGRLFGRKDGDTSATLAGVLSVDLTQIFTRKPAPKLFTPERRDPSSVFWQPFPIAAGNQAITTLAFRMEGDIPEGTPFRVISFQKSEPPLAKGKMLTMTWHRDQIYSLSTLLPIGTYMLIPQEGVKVLDDVGNEVEPMRDGSFGNMPRGYLFEVTNRSRVFCWTLKKA